MPCSHTAPTPRLARVPPTMQVTGPGMPPMPPLPTMSVPASMTDPMARVPEAGAPVSLGGAPSAGVPVPMGLGQASAPPSALTSEQLSKREARQAALHKYKQKRKNLHFGKRIRYQSRKVGAWAGGCGRACG